MNHSELKQTIKEDIALIKTLEFEIFSARIYYGGLIKLFGNCFWKIGLIVLLSMIYVDYSLMFYNPMSYSELITDVLLYSFFLTGIGFVFLIPMLTQYYLIQIHLQHRIKSGQLLMTKLNQWVNKS
jgi:hypothetical protein